MISGNEKPQIKKLLHYDYVHWLNLIHNFAKKSPILIIQNKIDYENGKWVKNFDVELDDFNVKDTFHLSIKEAYNQKGTKKKYDRDFENFKLDLIELLQDTAKGREIQVYIANVRKKIQEHVKDNTWDWKQYEKFCYKEAKAEMTDQRMKILTQYLHDTGVILYYGYSASLQNSILKNKVFINSNYVTNTIYNILDYKVQEDKGKFTKQHVVSQLQNNKKEAEIFIALMQSPDFELIFKSKQEAETYYATQYLHQENPEKDTKSFKKLSRKTKIALVLYFPNFFSLNIMSHFIARKGIDIKDNIVWKYGIIFEQNDIDFFVECKFKEKKIFIKTDLNNKTHHLIKKIFDDFIELSDKDISIELSLNKEKGFSLQQIKQNPEKYLEFQHLIPNKMPNKRIDTINEQINDLFDLLSKYEKKQITEDDPKREMKNEEEIKKIKKQIGEKQQELTEAGNSINIEENGNSQYLKSEFEKLHNRHNRHDKDLNTIDNKIDDLLIELKDEIVKNSSTEQLQEIEDLINYSISKTHQDLIDITDEIFKYMDYNFSDFKQYSEGKYKDIFDKLKSGKNTSAKVKFGFSFLKLLDLTGIPIGTILKTITDLIDIKFEGEYKIKFKKIFFNKK